MSYKAKIEPDNMAPRFSKCQRASSAKKTDKPQPGNGSIAMHISNQRNSYFFSFAA